MASASVVRRATDKERQQPFLGEDLRYITADLGLPKSFGELQVCLFFFTLASSFVAL